METFVIRVWTPAGDEHDADTGRLRGFVEHVRLGVRRSFEDDDQLLAFLREGCTPETPDTTDTDRAAAKRES